jgi:hypothetical protein
MAKRSTIILAVVAFLTLTVVAWADFTYVGEYVTTTKGGPPSTSWQGFFNQQAPATTNDVIAVYTSPADDTRTKLFDIINSGGGMIRPDAFSYSNDIPAFLDQDVKTLTYTTVNNYDENGPTTTKYGFNDDMLQLNSYGVELNIQHAESAIKPLGPSPTGYGNSLGVQDIINGVGRPVDGYEYVLSDYEYTAAPATGAERIYFSAGKTATYNGIFSQILLANRPAQSWGSGGSDYLGKAHAADILTGTFDEYGLVATTGYFEKAWKLAGLMLGDQFWTSGLVWNVQKGYVSTSTASTAPEAAGHVEVRDFMRYIFDIDAVKVYDANGNGVYDAATDMVLFSVVDDKYFGQYYDWANTQQTVVQTNPSYFENQFFDGDTLFLYRDSAVTTYMDKGSNIFFGETISTTNATIWGEKWGEYDITAFDIDVPIPEPSTVILIVGAGLTLGAGILRKRMR